MSGWRRGQVPTEGFSIDALQPKARHEAGTQVRKNPPDVLSRPLGGSLDRFRANRQRVAGLPLGRKTRDGRGVDVDGEELRPDIVVEVAREVGSLLVLQPQKLFG